jgi:dipeptidyl aminopeptidase/acylaminoacyl peptidase
VEEQLPNGANYERYIVSYRSEGLKIYALLTIPFGDIPEDGWPAIVFNHGYIPPEIYRTTERYVAYVNAFATNGYVVFRPDYRGHGFSEGEARGAYGNPDYVIDVLNAFEAVRNHPLTDPNRIGMWGHSMGGYITLRAMVVNPDVKAGVIWAGVVGSYADLYTDWFSRPNRTWPTRTPSPNGDNRTSIVLEYGTPDDNPEFWAAASANTYLRDLSGPVQIHHGTNDASVPLILSEKLHDGILAVGGSTEFYIYEGDDHNLSIGFSLAMQRSINFFDVNLKGD